MIKYEFHPEALEEYQQAALWYRKKGSELMLRFIEAIEDAIVGIVESPERWPVLEDDVRRCMARVFPMVCSIRSRPTLYSLSA